MKTAFTTTFSAIAILTLTALFITGCASTRPLAAKEAHYPTDQVNAHALYVENCASCHGQDGRADTFHGWLVGAQNLTDPMWWEDTTDAEITHAIKTGPGLMPAFAKKLSPSEIQALTRYIDSLHTAALGNQ